MGTLLDGQRVFAMNECGCYGCILWVLFLDGQNFGNECGYYGCIAWVLFWKDTIVAMNVGMWVYIRGVFYGVLFWMNIILAMNVGM